MIPFLKQSTEPSSDGAAGHMVNFSPPDSPGRKIANYALAIYYNYEITFLCFFVLCMIFPVYVIINYLSVGRNYTLLDGPIDRLIPFVPAAEFVYALIYVMAFAPASIVRDPIYFRRIAMMFTGVTMVGNTLFLLFPVMMIRFIPAVDSFVTWGIAVNNYLDPPYNCFPSLHVGNAFAATWAIYHVHRPLGYLSFAISVLISLSTLLVKQHYLMDVIAGFILAWFFYRLLIKTYLIPEEQKNSVIRAPAWFGIVPLVYVLGVAVLYLVYLSGVEIPRPAWEIAQHVIYWP